MAKRIKQVFSNHTQVIHLWANQSQPAARCRNVFFEGKSVYSYGRHYELGRIIEVNGHQVAMINDRGYSVTTSKHIYEAWHAVSHMPRLKTKGNLTDVQGALLETSNKLVDELVAHFRSRKFSAIEYERSEYTTMSRINEFNKTCILLGFKKLVLNVNAEFIQDYNDHIRVCIARKAARDAAFNTPEAITAREAKDAEEIQAWRLGTGPRTNAVSRLHPMILRVKGETVYTSGGAEVPLNEALTLLKRLESGKVETGAPIGSFEFNSMNGNLVIIGCHVIDINEAKQVLTPFIKERNLKIAGE